MLLPIFPIGVTCAYAIFNKNAYQSYYGETINDEQIHNGYDDLEQTYFYQFQLAIVDSGSIEYNVSSVKKVSGTFAFQQDVENIKQIYVYLSSGIHYTRVQFNDNSYQYVQNLNSNFDNYVLSFNLISKPVNAVFSDYIYWKSYNRDSFVSEVFYYSIDRVQQSPLFNWAYDSFLATPITYITNLFGIASNHISVMLMSYWLAISVIWLVFDLIMYVPLLVHRWLDKGVLE